YLWHQFHEADFCLGFYFKCVVEALGLLVADENEEAVALESFKGAIELLLPIDLAAFAKLVAVTRALGFGRFDQTAKVFRLARIIILHLLVYARSNQFTN